VHVVGQDGHGRTETGRGETGGTASANRVEWGFWLGHDVMERTGVATHINVTSLRVLGG
jgi:hypothetical protein